MMKSTFTRQFGSTEDKMKSKKVKMEDIFEKAGAHHVEWFHLSLDIACCSLEIPANNLNNINIYIQNTL